MRNSCWNECKARCAREIRQTTQKNGTEVLSLSLFVVAFGSEVYRMKGNVEKPREGTYRDIDCETLFQFKKKKKKKKKKARGGGGGIRTSQVSRKPICKAGRQSSLSDRSSGQLPVFCSNKNLCHGLSDRCWTSY